MDLVISIFILALKHEVTLILSRPYFKNDLYNFTTARAQ